jgi:hypothetical protein
MAAAYLLNVNVTTPVASLTINSQTPTSPLACMQMEAIMLLVFGLAVWQMSIVTRSNYTAVCSDSIGSVSTVHLLRLIPSCSKSQWMQ